MITLVIFWVSTSVFVCLALLGAAARRVPRLDDQMTAAAEPVLVPQAAVASDQVETTCTLARAKPRSTSARAMPQPPTPLLLPDPDLSAREVPLFLRIRPAISKANHLVQS
jgi:hypothetical protein